MGTEHDSERRREFVDRVHAHQRILHRVGAVYASGPAERDDLMQEILLQLWRSYPSFRGDASFATWMYRVALNTALLSRRRARGADGGTSAERASREAPAPPGRDQVEAAEDVRLLYACIRELPELDRAVVLLHLEDEPHATIAEVTGLAPGNVAVRLHRLKHRLRERLLARGFVPEETP